jgi:DNA-binding NtrC family response regulator
VVSDRILPLDEVEREYILAAVRAVGGNKTRAAADLKIALSTLLRKLKGYENRGLPAAT